MAKPSEAVISAAGLGTRFGGANDIKQLAQLGIIGIVDRNVGIMVEAGIRRVIIVTGHRRHHVETGLGDQLSKWEVDVTFVANPEYRKSNGISAMLGGEAAEGPFLLLMADHVFEAVILNNAVGTDAPKVGGVLYVDSKIDQVYDLDDATKVLCDESGHIVTIGKQLREFNVIDTGLFVVNSDLCRVLRRIYEQNGDCSLSEGIQKLADTRVMHTRNIGAAGWQDIDTEELVDDVRMTEQLGACIRQLTCPSVGERE